jgi:hypothetical protein
LKHFLLGFVLVAVGIFAGSYWLHAADVPKAAPDAPKSARSDVTDVKEQEDLSRAMLAMVLAQNNLLAERSKYPALIAAEQAVGKANDAYGVLLQAARVKHNAGPQCELVAASKAWNCPADAPPGK